MKTIAQLAALALLAASTMANPSEPGQGSLVFHLDNDLFAQTDSNYTNGARVSWISGDKDRPDSPMLRKALVNLQEVQKAALRRLFGHSERGDLSFNSGISLTQLMFTPENETAPEPPPGQRPYAGWLGLGLSQHSKDAQALNTVEISLGILGPESFAEEAQDFIHDLRGQNKFAGWDSQLPTEPTLNLFFVQKRKLGFLSHHADEFAIDSYSESRIALGNFRTDISAGAMTRLGWNLPTDFSDARVTPTAYNQTFKNPQHGTGGGWSCYGLAGFRGYLIAHDITLDGPLFRSYDRIVTPETLLGEAYLGFGIAFRHFELSYTHTFQTQTFEEQSGGHQFGSLAFRFR